MTLTYSSIFTFLNAYCSPFPVSLKPLVGGELGEVPSIAACSFNIVMFQYHARYTSRGGSKPFLAGFQPPKTIFLKKVFCLVSLNIKVILSPRHLNAVLTRCDRAFLCSRTPEAPEQTAGEYIKCSLC